MRKETSTNNMVLTALLTAIVFVLQFVFAALMRAGVFSFSLVLVPIVIGAALCGSKVGAWLGFVFGVAVLLSGDAGPFLAVNVPGTIITVLVKGILCGYLSGLTYELFKKYSKTLSVFLAAVVCPIVNTGVFLIGCLIFFLDIVSTWAGGMDVAQYMFFGLAGINFLIELVCNIVLSPIIVRLIDLRQIK